MQKQAPTLGRLLTMVLFALSCFGLLLFLWLAFGGPVPLKPKGYRYTVAVPEANQLAIEADVRSSGVPIGKIKGLEQAPRGNKTLVTVELERKYAPLCDDARVIQRQKTILGEKYLEITRGTPGCKQVSSSGTRRARSSSRGPATSSCGPSTPATPVCGIVGCSLRKSSPASRPARSPRSRDLAGRCAPGGHRCSRTSTLTG